MTFKSILIKDSSKKKKFWKLERGFDSLVKTKFEKPPKITISGVLRKFSKKSQSMMAYSFFIVGPYFGYYNLNGPDVRYLDLSLCILTEIPQKSSYSPCGFSLTRHRTNKKDFYMDENFEQDEWYQKLRRFCIQTNFLKHYELYEQLGKGNFSSVYRAKSKRDGRMYAAKAINTDGLSKSSKLRQAVRTELSVHRNLSHPSILQFIEAYEDEDKIYIMTELLEGGELFERTLVKKRYTEKEAAIVMKQILEALIYLEIKGIIHRDLKLENVLLVRRNDDCYIKIADFGLSIPNQKVDTKTRCGTPGYIAPEMILEKSYDCKVDVFSVGAMLYILLSGCTPFPGKTFDEILARNKKCNPKFNSSYWSTASFEAIDFIVKMMSPDPAKRPTAFEALNSNWMKSALDQHTPSHMTNHTDAESLVKSIEYKINIETTEDKVATESDNIPTVISVTVPTKGSAPTKAHAFQRKHSLTVQPDSEAFNRVSFKRHSLVGEQKDQNSMHKKVMQRNLIKKLETFDPAGFDEVSESYEQSFSQTPPSKFEFKSGLLVNSFYAKGGSQGTQGTSSDIDSPPSKRITIEPQESPARMSVFGRLYSLKNEGTPASQYDNLLTVPNEESSLQDIMDSLRTKAFSTKPAFGEYDTGDDDVQRPRIFRFPEFKNALTSYPRRKTPLIS